MSNIIDKIRLSGVTYTLSASTAGGSPTVELTQAEYDALVTAGTVAQDTYYIITDAPQLNVTSAVTSGSTDVITSGGVYEQLGGLSMVKLTQAEYDALVSAGTVSNTTVYYIVG